MAKRVVNPDALADPSVYSYSHAIVTDGQLHMSGQVGIDSDGELAGTDIVSQARQAYENVEAILEAAGGGFEDVVKVTTNMVDPQSRFGEYHEVWVDTFAEPYPCHTVLGVDQLADEAYLVELEVDASVTG